MSVMKQIAILGSTGSIGRQTLEVVRALPRHFQVAALAGGKNVDLFCKQIDEFKPRLVYFQDKGALTLLTSAEYEFLTMEDIARHPEVDIVVIATSGGSGLNPTLAATRAGKNIALANKESLIFPVDSEHSAIWQCLNGERQPAAQLLLTASGGPFLHYSPAQLNKVTVEQALRHPSWQMGRKVTIDKEGYH